MSPELAQWLICRVSDIPVTITSTVNGQPTTKPENKGVKLEQVTKAAAGAGKCYECLGELRLIRSRSWRLERYLHPGNDHKDR